MRQRSSFSPLFQGALRIGCAALLCYGTAMPAQNVNPQPNFADQVMSAKPSVYLNFNDASARFKDSVTGSVFGGSGQGAIAPLDGNAFWGALDGSDNYISAPSALKSNAVFSYIGNVYVPSTSESGQFFGNNALGATTSGGVTVGVGAAGSPVNFAGTGNQLIVLSAGVAWNWTGSNIGTGWHCIAVTRDGTTMRAYIDGTQTGTIANATLAPTAPGSGPMLIGGVPPSSGAYPNFDGGMSNWEMASAAATQAQIQAFCSSGTDIPAVVGKWKLNEGTGSTAVDSSGNGNNGTWHGTASGNAGYYLTATSGAVLPRQPGFDATQADNTAAAFPYNGFSVAPNNALGSVEWNVPYSMLVHVDRLNWNRSGSLVLASKGDVSGATNWWKLYLQMAGTTSQLCFSRGTTGASNGICTSGGFDAMPNGLNYDIVVTDAGTGAPGGGYCGGCTSPLSLYINGLGPSTIPETPTSGSFASGFGYVTLAIAGGTGYASSTSFTSTGGGATCNVTGVMLATNGVPTSVTAGTGSNNFGCTSAPTITLISPTGTGAMITATPTKTSMNAAGEPLLIPGYISGGNYYGVAGTNSAQTRTYIDEAGIFPGVLSPNEITELFYQTKFYQGLMKSYATPPLVIFSNDGCQDTDNFFDLTTLIRAHQLGEVKLIGVEDVQGGGTSPAFYRQELDQAGLSQVPVSVSSSFAASFSLCPSAMETAFDASTAQNTAAYESSVTMYRTLFAKYATTPILVTSGGSLAGMDEFIQSPADSVSSMTGAQLWAQNARNGGAVYGQGLGENFSFGSYYDEASSVYMFANNMPMPIYWFGGTPQQAGPGILESRTVNDPLWMVFNALGNDVRPCWDCLTATAILSNAFAGGVNVAISGTGTGYANATPFTSTGGGPNCVVTGTMVSVNGVPSSILSSEGTALNTATGTGAGCLNASSPPTIVLTNPTGTGAVLTSTTTASPCGTITQTTASNGVTAQTSCTNQYFVPYSLYALPGATPVFEWFLNSLDDPIPVGSPRRQ
ncbi:MAG: LamG domain-containing protein [Acidobacteria bacterium]|nr:LamG domain-containing protein [Acidobacteriota bacterium]